MKSIDIRPIVNNFYNDIFEDETRSNWEAYILLFIPSIFSLISIIRPIDSQFISTMSTALAILFGFTFTSLMSTARYSAKDDPLEEEVVRETRISTAYALLVNLCALIAIVGVTIAVVDFSGLGPVEATAISASVYFLLFHYLIVMLHLMRYLYLLSIGGAFESAEQTENNQENGVNDDASTMQVKKI